MSEVVNKWYLPLLVAAVLVVTVVVLVIVIVIVPVAKMIDP